MKCLVAILLLVAGCATRQVLSTAPRCPDPVLVPAPLVGTPTPAKVSALEIRVELAREQERARGDCWRNAAGGTKK